MSRALSTQTKTEVALTLRRGESVLLTLGIPIVLLVFFSVADVLPEPDRIGDAVDFLFPGVLALAVMSAAMVGPAIATGFEREYGVLKRLAITPLGRPRLIASDTVAPSGSGQSEGMTPNIARGQEAITAWLGTSVSTTASGCWKIRSIPWAKRTGSRRCRTQYCTDLASCSPIQSPVTLER